MTSILLLSYLPTVSISISILFSFDSPVLGVYSPYTTPRGWVFVGMLMSEEALRIERRRSHKMMLSSVMSWLAMHAGLKRVG